MWMESMTSAPGSKTSTLSSLVSPSLERLVCTYIYLVSELYLLLESWLNLRLWLRSHQRPQFNVFSVVSQVLSKGHPLGPADVQVKLSRGGGTGEKLQSVLTQPGGK